MNVALLSQPQRELRAYLQRVAGDGGIVETPGEASTFIRRLRSAGVLGSTVIAGVAGGVKAGTLYSIIGPDLDVTRGTVKNRVNRAGVLSSRSHRAYRLRTLRVGCFGARRLSRVR
jgi:hypothetical protein